MTTENGEAIDAAYVQAYFASDADTKDFITSAVTLWISGIGALFVLSLTGVFTYADAIANLPPIVKILIVVYFADLAATLVLLGWLIFLFVAVFEKAHSYLKFAALASEARLVERFKRDREKLGWLAKNLANSARAAGIGSALALVMMVLIVAEMV